MIGSRLKQARLLAGMKQIELASQLNEAGYKITAAAVSKYENDKSYPPCAIYVTREQNTRCT